MTTTANTTTVAWPQGVTDVDLGTAPPSAWTLTHLTAGEGGTTLCGRTIPWDVAENAASHRGPCRRCLAAERHLEAAAAAADRRAERAADAADRAAAAEAAEADRLAADAALAPHCAACGHRPLELDALDCCFHCGAPA